MTPFVLFALLFVPTDAPKPDADIDAVAKLLVGEFTSAAQAKADPTYFEVHLHMARIWNDKPGDCWIYVEQAMATTPDKPYRQRVYHIIKEQDGSLASVVYHLPGDPLKFAGAWKQPKPLAEVKITQLVEKPGCAIALTRQPDGSYAGATRGHGCATELNGGAYATSEVNLRPDRLETWDRGFNKDDKQVWGAKAGPYRFDRVVPK